MATNTVDGIVRYQGGIVVIERAKPPFGLALPGGHVEDNETLEAAIDREIGEEIGLNLTNRAQFRTYSEPSRDPRGRYISTVFTADGYGTLAAGDDAKNARVISLDEIDRYRFAFDHQRILADYRAIRLGSELNQTTQPTGTFYVAYKRDLLTEDRREYSGRQLYDCLKKFTQFCSAREFAEAHLPCALIKTAPTELDLSFAKNHKKPYAVIIEHHGKYSHTDWTGDSDPLRTYDVVHCSVQNLEKVCMRAASEKGFEKLYRGIELKPV